MAASQRRKGARYEVEVARDLTKLGIESERAARCGVGRGEDLLCWTAGRRDRLPLTVECKRRAALACERHLEQAEATAKPGDVAMVAMRGNNGESMVLLRLGDLIRLARVIAKALGEPVFPESE